MKPFLFSFLLPLLVFFGHTTFASQRSLEQEVLFAIDRQCADNWCESDVDFSFLAFEVTSNGYSLHFTAGLSANSQMPYTCSGGPLLPGEHFLEYWPEYQLPVLTSKFLDQLNECFNQKVFAALIH